MRVMFLAFLAVGVIAVAAWYGLHEVGFSTADKTTSNAVRLD